MFRGLRGDIAIPLIILLLYLFHKQAFATENTESYIFLGNKNLPPFIYLQDGKPTGLVVDLVYAVAEKGKMDIEVQAVDWSLAQKKVLEGEADALLQINHSPEREEIYDFSKPLLESQFTIFHKSERVDIQNIVSLYGKTVGVENKGYPILLLKKYPQINVKIISGWKQGFEQVLGDDIDAVILDRWVGENELSSNKIMGISMVENPVEVSYSAIAVRKGNQKLLAKINYGLDAIAIDGTRDKILKKWRKKEIVYFSREEIYWGSVIAVFSILLILIIVFWNRSLRREIRKRVLAEAEQVILQKQLQQKHKMESLGQVTAGIAHDFNNLLAVIDGYADLLKSELKMRNEDKLYGYVSEIRKAGERATKLVSQMLIFSRKNEGERKRVFLDRLLQEDLPMLRASIPSSVEIDVVNVGDLPEVEIDPVQLNQVFLNLVVNARDAMDARGKITMQTEFRQRIDAEDSVTHQKISGDWVVLSVSDTGVGIAPELQERIFDPFFTTKDVGYGTGMGLSVVFGIVKTHHGHVLLESEPGVGTTINILLPPAKD